jgi:hypothetical protein
VLVVALLTIDGLTRFGVLVGDSPVWATNTLHFYLFQFNIIIYKNQHLK